MATASDVLRVAASQIGYSRWADPEAGTRYGRWYAAKTGTPFFGASGVPFCAMGVSWVLDQVGTTPPGGIFAYVPYGINNAKSRGRTVTPRSAVPGDLVCFDWNGDGLADHVGFVEFNRGSYLQTIEFNTSSGVAGSQGNGGGVYRRTRNWDVVCAVIRPEYSSAVAIPTGDTTKYQTIPDGWWGSNTTKDLQSSQGTPRDGVVSSQWTGRRGILAACTTGWEWTNDPKGSTLILSMQRDMGITPDGIAGPDFVNHLETRFGFSPDGHLDGPSNTVKQLQLRLAKTGKF